ncbi:MAG: hypothetical protein Q9160_006849 [Pyrenula sp. 1 TL-2023]
MSLNGLDEGLINEAYQAALAEAGGWILVRYSSRDAVELHGRGNGGVVEVRSTIEQYPEKSPLYGFVQYRRRRVVLKYVPEGTSRLLQARVTVHFQSVLERFSPYDTTFSIAAPTDITETALSSACMLHTSGSFTSSSSSLRRKRLDEIAEDAEEAVTEKGTPQKGAIDTRTELEENSGEKTPTRPPPGRSDSIPTVAISAPSLPSSPSRNERTDYQATEPVPETTSETTRENPSRVLDHPKESSPILEDVGKVNDHDDGESYRQYLQQLSRPSIEPRRSTQSARPSAFDIEKSSIYSGYSSHRIRVKRGPRPSLDQLGRPKTSGQTQIRSGEPRPVSTLPSSIRFSPRPASHVPQSPKASQHSRSPSNAGSTTTVTPSIDQSITSQLTAPGFVAPTQPETTQASSQISSFYRPPLFTTNSSQSTALASKPPGITPEKERLMRALQLRKKQQAQHQKEREERERRASETAVGESAHLDNGSVTQDSEANNQAEHTMAESAQTDGQGSQNSENSVESGHVGSTNSTENTAETASTKRSSFTGVGDHAAEIQHDLKTGVSQTQDSETRSSSLLHSEDKGIQPIVNASDPESTEATEAIEPLDIKPVPMTPPLSGRASTLESNLRNETTAEVLPAEPSQAIPHGDTTTVNERGRSPVRTLSQKRASTSPLLESPKSSKRPHLSIRVEQPPRTSSSEARPHASDNYRLSSTERFARRQGIVDPLKNSPTSDLSNISDDDAFLEELQSAKLEEAKPITVARSPATPIFPKGTHDLQRPSLTDIKASVSPKAPQKGFTTDSKSPSPPRPPSKSSLPSDVPSSKPPVLRSASGRTLPQWPPPAEATPHPLTKKVSVSTGISKRIKALELFSGRDSSASPPPTQAPATNSPPKIFKTRMSWAPNRHAPNMTTSTPPSSRLSSAKSEPPPYPTPEKTPPTPARQLNNHKTQSSSPKKTRESIQVTARIIRDIGKPSPVTSESVSDPVSLTLHRSPLIVEREKREPAVTPPLSEIEAIQPKRMSAHNDRAKNEKQRHSMTPSLSAKRPSFEFAFSRPSFSSLSRPKTSEISLPRSTSETSSLYNGEEREKKESRRSRIMRRMSNLTSGSRRSVASALSPSSTSKEESFTPTIQEHIEILPEPGPEPEVPQHRTPQHVVDIGDVNVQFPDTLLWKRRFMRIDDQGYLILTPPTMDTNTRNISRKFRLTDFRKPVIPDLDRQELPHSILLDFEDGSCLQCACESKYAQTQTLRMLVDAHAAYNQLYN